jgi:hypothetical protein
MRAWVAVLTATISACRPAGRLEPHTRTSRLHVTFVAETDSFRLNSGYRDKPMHLRASYPTATKKATLMHELGHRLESDLFRASENDHPYLFLWLYPAWVSAYGEDFARDQVAVEKRRGGVYPAAWDDALALTATGRAARWDSVRASRAHP